MWNNYPVHQMEKRKPLPEYIYDLEPFKEVKGEPKILKKNIVSEQLKLKHKRPDIDNLLKSRAEYLDPNYVEKYKKEE